MDKTTKYEKSPTKKNEHTQEDYEQNKIGQSMRKSNKINEHIKKKVWI